MLVLLCTYGLLSIQAVQVAVVRSLIALLLVGEGNAEALFHCQICIVLGYFLERFTRHYVLIDCLQKALHDVVGRHYSSHQISTLMKTFLRLEATV